MKTDLAIEGCEIIPNYIPYLVLILISIIIFILSWRKAASKKLIPFYLCMAGFIYLFEYVILVLFKSYEYFTGVFKDDYFDNVLGANISNGFIVPSVTVLIAVFNLEFWWIFLIIIGFLGIEELFLYLGVYRHFWWRTFYTGVSLFIHFYLGKYLWCMIRYHVNRFTLRITVLYFANIAIQGTFMFYLVALFHLFLFHVNWFNDPSRDHITFVTLYFFIDSIFFSIVVVLRAYWFWHALLIIGLACINVLLHQVGILEISSNWVLCLLTVFQICELFLLMLMYRLLHNSMSTQ
ncbi:hypothetical protein WQ54_23885 [Bacillus sp. SA1-12]|uniref:hypothetical protein n=1 Tax=Bacillus sp. SA1-12 TaxID=1455638 RepID=UPI00062705F5|nr:hypothetical protein [Bacillus sp. SA1-12]KKI90137.1 hypothetical protein WQ54_23885 [Bacillus sp. SA1-12]